MQQNKHHSNECVAFDTMSSSRRANLIRNLILLINILLIYHLDSIPAFVQNPVCDSVTPCCRFHDIDESPASIKECDESYPRFYGHNG